MDRRELRYRNGLLLVDEAGGLTEFAEEMEMSLSQASQILGKNPVRGIGNDLAPRMEEKFKKPVGWLDQIHHEIDSASISGAKRVTVIGVLERGGKEDDWEMREDKGKASIIDFRTEDSGCYALRIRGDGLQPRIRSGECIVVEPSIKPQPGDHVLVVLKTGRRAIKELRQVLGDEFRFGPICGSGEPITIFSEDIEAIHRISSISIPLPTTKG